MASKAVVWVGRLNHAKGEIAKRLALDIFPQFPDAEFFLLGGPEPQEGYPEVSSNVHFVGQVQDVSGWYRNADLVIGAGRVALEAMQAGVPLLALGEATCLGILNKDAVEVAKKTNFGDVYEPRCVDYEKVGAELRAFLHGESKVDTSFYPELLKEYDGQRVQLKVMSVYQQARLKNNLQRTIELPVLMYHQIPVTQPEGARYSIYTLRDTLREQFESLCRRGFTPITFAELVEGKIVDRPIVLTFDDGYRNHYEEVLPLLQEFGFKAVFFVLGDRALSHNRWDTELGELSYRLMDAAQIKACHESGLVEIGSHSMSHSRLTDLDSETARWEIGHSRRLLADLTGAPVVSFCYPYGDYSTREAEYVMDVGYQFGVGTVSGPLRFATDLCRIRRVQMRSRDRAFAFWKKSSGYYLRYCWLTRKDF